MSTYYHVTEECNLDSILRQGLTPKVTHVSGEEDPIRGIWLSRYPKHLWGWEDFECPILLKITLPPSWAVHTDEAGMEVYPEAEPVYVARRIPPRYIKLAGPAGWR